MSKKNKEVKQVLLGLSGLSFEMKKHRKKAVQKLKVELKKTDNVEVALSNLDDEECCYLVDFANKVYLQMKKDILIDISIIISIASIVMSIIFLCK